MIDFHSHILPGMDDGANDIKESLDMLESLYNQGITTVVATPHYRSECAVSEFLEKRRICYDNLKSAMESSGKKYPSIILGAEVEVNGSLLEQDELHRLCIEGTNYILAEMPERFWEPFLYHIIFSLTAQHRIKVMIAHVDRYYTSFGSNEKVMKLIDMHPVFQISSAALMCKKGKKLLQRMYRMETEFVFGTDCHNMKSRKPLWAQPMKYIIKKYGVDFLDEINCFGEKLLKNNQ